MAQTFTHKRNVRVKPKEIAHSAISDWNEYLYSLWRKRIELNPEFYDDAMLHHGWSCKCCSRTIFYVEEHKKK